MRLLSAPLMVLLALALSGTVAAQTASSPGAQPPAGGAMNSALVPPPKFLARDLLAACDAADNTAQQRGCLSYLQGAAAMYDMAVAEGKDMVWFCTPREAPPGLLRQQYVSWSHDNPDQMGLDAIQALRLALADAFPCQE